MVLYAITDRRLLGVADHDRRAALVGLAREWARGGVDYIQIREKDLSGEELLELSRLVVAAVDEERMRGAKTKVILNGAAEIALAAGADGVHLPGRASAEIVAAARETFARAGRECVVSVACHSVEEAALVEASPDSLILFAPVFEKPLGDGEALPGRGLEELARVCSVAHVPVSALGGITPGNARDCVTAGAAGVAAIRMFVGKDWMGL
jgi:thiamine-phosphate pyrophosphorylase